MALQDDLIDISHPLRSRNDLDILFEKSKRAKAVLLGEATHGTAEFYNIRAEISKRLIEDAGYSFIGIEGDWPDIYKLNRYIKGDTAYGKSAKEIMHGFKRWPTWMWANHEVMHFIEWLKEYNKSREKQIGFYGLDVYSLWESMDAIIHFLEEADPDAARKAIEAYMCFEPYERNAQEYAWATNYTPASCEEDVLNLLQQTLNRHITVQTKRDREEEFNVVQNALVAVDAEKYYRIMIRSDNESWNIRDRHMVETFRRLMEFYGNDAKGIIWAHNTHVGDARATDMAEADMVNVGELIRKEYGSEDVYIIGFSTYKGTVIASRRWGDPMEHMRIPEGVQPSWEHILHTMEGHDTIITFDEYPAESLRARSQRAIGVVYRPEYEIGNYVPTILPRRYDALVFIDITHALHPMHMTPERQKEYEYYPTGF